MRACDGPIIGLLLDTKCHLSTILRRRWCLYWWFRIRMASPQYHHLQQNKYHCTFSTKRRAPGNRLGYRPCRDIYYRSLSSISRYEIENARINKYYKVINLATTMHLIRRMAPAWPWNISYLKLEGLYGNIEMKYLFTAAIIHFISNITAFLGIFVVDHTHLEISLADNDDRAQEKWAVRKPERLWCFQIVINILSGFVTIKHRRRVLRAIRKQHTCHQDMHNNAYSHSL